ncbi:RDD family protein [Rufibacter sp. LB8]|uniref:RDD family protein n=1 Tax=Rufibacter sp. LB8 TaxID=2777781 RepID=UPI00178C5B3E|nr:RDD family protein [Rufibacter sp. LB8]
MNTIKVKTTQNVEVEYAIASVGDRIIAYLIDLAISIGWFFVCMIIFVGVAAAKPSENSYIVLVVLFLLPYFFYDLLCEVFLNGQSLGKRAKDLKVIKLNGQSPSLGDYLLRWMFRLLDITFYGIVAIVTISINGKGQRVGDLAAATSVIKTQPLRRQDPFKVKHEDEYQLVYPEVAALTDRDMALIRKLLFKAVTHKNETLLTRISERVQEVMGVTPTTTHRDFLKTVIKDFHHLTAGVEA